VNLQVPRASFSCHAEDVFARTCFQSNRRQNSGARIIRHEDRWPRDFVLQRRYGTPLGQSRNSSEPQSCPFIPSPDSREFSGPQLGTYAITGLYYQCVLLLLRGVFGLPGGTPLFRTHLETVISALRSRLPTLLPKFIVTQQILSVNQLVTNP
jgi:hypothetical protein